MDSMQIKEITSWLESLAPLGSQESYDNAGFITGNGESIVTGALIALDCTEEIVDEAIRKNCNLVIAHHPIVFRGLKKLTGSNYIERTVIKAIKHDITIYACHTNLDNYKGGVSQKMGELMGVQNMRILSPSSQTLTKLAVFVPHAQKEPVEKAMFEQGAGHIGNYNEVSFSLNGTGAFKAGEGANPYIGSQGERHFEEEARIEVLVSNHVLKKVVQAMLEAHPYEEVAYDLYPLSNLNPYEGAGMIGELEQAISEKDFLSQLKTIFKCEIIRHTELLGKPIKKVAWCGGSGSFLLQKAMAEQADIYITGDFKYHEFFDADGRILIADIGHFESEQFTIERIGELLQKKFPTFAPCLTEINTNPVKYF